VTLAEWARSFGMHPQTTYRMPVPPRRRPWGTIVVEVSVGEVSGRTVVVYVRVFSREQQPDPGHSRACDDVVCSPRRSVDEVVTEVGSA
jgi:predicted site-specific integrase-resolvase